MGELDEIIARQLLRDFIAKVKALGGFVLICGGAVRDDLLGLPVKDCDIEVYGLDVEVLQNLLAMLSDKVEFVGKSFGVFKFRTNQCEFDVSLPRRERKVGVGHKLFDVAFDPSMSPKEAASRRDFTINSMMLDPLTGEVTDFFGGLEDMKKHVLRHVGPAFSEDPLRVLRGMQFAARFNMKLAPETAQLCNVLKPEYQYLPLDRVWVEWQKLFVRGRVPSAGLQALDVSGWIAFYPELLALKGVKQGSQHHPEGDVWNHTLLAVDAAADIAATNRLNDDDRTLLIMSVLCHDFGKPRCTTISDTGVKSYGHSHVGAALAQEFMRRIGAPLYFEKPVMALVENHMAHMDFKGSDRFVRRLTVKLAAGGTTITQLARVVEADQLGRPPVGKMPEEMVELVKAAERLAIKDSAPKPILMGRHLLELGVPPGPLYTKTLSAVFEEQLDGKVATLDEAIAFAKKLLENEKQSSTEERR